MMTVGEFKNHMTGMGHMGTLNKVRNFPELLQRAINTMLMKIDPIETERRAPLASPIHTDIYNYVAPTDYKRTIDIYPQDNRTARDRSQYEFIEYFGAETFRNKRITIESANGIKYLRVNWKSWPILRFGSLDSPTADGGTWIAVGTATAPVQDQLVKIWGTGSLKFSTLASGDGISNIGLNQFDLSDWNQESYFFKSLYIPDATSLANLTAVNAVVGDDITANYWTLPAQTAQFDGTAFQIGWNLLGYNWANAVETGTVDSSKLDSYKVTFTTTGPLTNIRLDNIVASLGRMFEMKYYSKYGIINTAGAWTNLTGSDDDEIVFDEDSINILLHEGLINIAQQLEGEDMASDVTYASRVLHGDPTAVDVSGRVGLYAQYRKAYPSQSKKPVARWSSGPRFRR